MTFQAKTDEVIKGMSAGGWGGGWGGKEEERRGGEKRRGEGRKGRGGTLGTRY